MLRVVAFCARAYVKFKSSGTVSDINKGVWCAKLILTAGLAYPLSCASLRRSSADGIALLFVSQCLP